MSVIAANFSELSTTFRKFKVKKKPPVTAVLAEKEGFEPSRRLPQPTPLAGEPLQPYLGTSPVQMCIKIAVFTTRKRYYKSFV